METVITNVSNTIFEHGMHSSSLLGQLFLNELESFETKCNTSIVQPDSATPNSGVQYFIDKSTNGTLIPISTNMESYTNLLNNRKTYRWCDYKHIFQNVTRKILTLDGNYSFTEALAQVEIFKEKAGEHFYGAIFRRNNILINPYHILTPISYLKDPTKFAGTFKVLLFFYSNRSTALKLIQAGPVKIVEKNEINTILNNIIKCANHKAEAKVPKTVENYFFTKHTLHAYADSIAQGISNTNAQMKINSISYATISADEITKDAFDTLDFLSTRNESTSGTTYLLSAHQVMVNGIFAPEYGVSLLKKTQTSLKGTFLTPSVSCNISSDSLQNSLTWANVCTGRESQQTFEGISSLHCSNYASAYNSSSHSNMSILLADLSIARASEIYKMAGILADKLTDTFTTKELEFVGNFEGYLDYMLTKYKLDLPEIEDRYKKLIDKVRK